MPMKKQKIFVIGGPTASGKSSLAIELAQKIQGEIVNADAVQVYEDLRILSARPSEEDEKLVPHHLFGYIDAWTTPTIVDWLNSIKDVLPAIQNPIVVGGTGMYIDALIQGISPIPDVPVELRSLVREMPIEEVKRRVQRCPFSDPQRVRRALEVQLATGKPLSYFQKLKKKKFVDADFVEIHMLPDREQVYHSCKQRFEIMKQMGVIDEVKKVLVKNPTGGVLKAIGVREIGAYLAGALTEKQMTEEVVTATKQYAKRQMTWFRHHGNPKFVITDRKNVDFDEITK